MKQILEGLVNFKTKISDLLHPEVTNSFNKSEFHFHGTVNFIVKQSKELKKKINSPFNGERNKQIIDKLGERV